jgi:hypothetical protein
LFYSNKIKVIKNQMYTIFNFFYITLIFFNKINNQN